MNLGRIRKEKKLTQQKLADKLHISRGALAMWETSQSQPTADKLIELSQILDESIDNIVGNKRVSANHSIRIPVLGTVAAGIPMDAIEDVVDWEEIPETMARGGEYFGLKIKGGSMEPRIKEGDTVIVRKQETVESGEIAIVLVNGDEATCKRVVKHKNGGISLMAFNPAVYETHFYTPDEILSLPVRILGKVVELRGKF
ncbi:MAG: helix-turn-helix domain-containing protein [Clostridia bacterium]|nr:helix-turn-helix domain-containing protein [Clostridia bacterium]